MMNCYVQKIRIVKKTVLTVFRDVENYIKIEKCFRPFFTLTLIFS